MIYDVLRTKIEKAVVPHTVSGGDKHAIINKS